MVWTLCIFLWVVFGLDFFHGTIVICEDEGALVFGVHISSCSFVSWAEIALELLVIGGAIRGLDWMAYCWVVVWKCDF